MPLPLRAAACLAVTCRPEIDEDLPFLEALYASVRAAEFAHLGWAPERLRGFLASQHRAQHAFQRSHYEGADWLILVRDGQPIGRLCLGGGPDRISIIDMSLVEGARAQGIGTAILTDLIDIAVAEGKSLCLMVEKDNPARRLYERLGFELRGEHGLHVEMARRPPPEA